MDPALPARVLSALGLAAAPGSEPDAARGSPAVGWRRTVAVLLLAAGACALAAAVEAGPVEAREAWKRAQAAKTGAWSARVRLLREVRGHTGPTDSVYARALRAEAAVWREARRAHAAAAAEAWAAGLGPASDPDRTGALLTHARALRDEGDDAAARPALAAAADVARSAMPWRADEALELLAEDAEERGDERALRAAVERMEKDDARPSSRIEGWSRLGMLHLARGDADDARQCLRRAERAYRDADDADPREAARATKAWLDALLRKALP
jgi:hypothetical protein